MSRLRSRGEQIRRFIVQHVESHPNDIARVTAEKFGISRQAVNKHLARLVDENLISREGNTRNSSYSLCPVFVWARDYELAEHTREDELWRERIVPIMGPLPENALDIWNYGFTEMFNNIIDHSQGTTASIEIERTAANTRIRLSDNGVGIFRKITAALKLSDERHAVLELAKGKLTTDPDRHTGEGIFFSSRMFDEFRILSGGVFFSHQYSADDDWIVESSPTVAGTLVEMKLDNHTSRTVRRVFDRFSTDDDYGFTRTVVPVRMAQYGDDFLVSRSQAKRILNRVDRFAIVVFDFKGVTQIGQAFADEIFRVFAREHPRITLQWINVNSSIKRMIARALSSAG